jgi:hypothetical protein
MQSRQPTPPWLRQTSLFSWKKAFVALALVVVSLFLFCYWYMVKCKEKANGEPLESRKSAELVEIKKTLETDAAYMQNLGPRNSVSSETYAKLLECEGWIRQRWQSQGYSVKGQTFRFEGREYSNLEIELPGRVSPSEIIIVSAQYDTLPDSPGANNNGSGVAILLSLSGLLRNLTPGRTLRLVNFVNEEDPFFDTEMMGSYVYAKRSRQRHEDIRVMLSLDALGIYTDQPGSQKLPFPFSLIYPNRGNFLSFIGDFRSRKHMGDVTRGFRKGSSLPIEAGVVPKWVKGAAWSDHVSFWKFGYPGIMVTDTGAFRSPSHNTKEDTLEKMNFEAMSRIVLGMYCSIVELTRTEMRKQ